MISGTGVIPDARGGRKPSVPVEFEIVRGLEQGDLEPLLANAASLTRETSKAPTVKELRSAHHRLAQLLATGMTGVEASLMTGYSQTRISILRADPAFGELLEHYRQVRELHFVDVLERMKQIGLNTLDEIQDRLEAAPEAFSARELMELTELMLVKGRTGPGAGPGGGASGSAGAGVVVNVKFVAPGSSSPTIEGELTDD